MNKTPAVFLLLLLGCSEITPGEAPRVDSAEFAVSTRRDCTFKRPDATEAPGACISYNFFAVKQAVDAAKEAEKNGKLTPEQKALLENQEKCGKNTDNEDEYCIPCKRADGTITGACKNGETNGAGTDPGLDATFNIEDEFSSAPEGLPVPVPAAPETSVALDSAGAAVIAVPSDFM